MPNHELLEKYSLYRKLRTGLPDSLDRLGIVAINMDCPKCGSSQTFNMLYPYYLGIPSNLTANLGTRGVVTYVVYECAYCNSFKRSFLLKFGSDANGDFVEKVGQDPPWDITSGRPLEKMLGPHGNLYKKGLICESQSYGIGAFAYYRRVLEEIILVLLAEVTELVPEQEKAKYLDGLARVKLQKTAEARLDVAKNLLPQSLVFGVNPLETLYSSLSEGLHAGSDGKCVELAVTIRQVLESLVIQIDAQKNAVRVLSESTKKLLAKKTSSP